MDAHVLIEARGLARHYGRHTAVSGLNLTLRKGEVLGLLGPNGAGKSTTMKMLTGNLKPSAGQVRIRDMDLRTHALSAKRSLGYLPEQPPVYPELTVDEYLGYCAGLHGVSRRERSAAVTAAKQNCGLTQVGRRLVGNLSKGYQQRVGLAQAIVHQPEVIILDEPTVGLDPIQIREIRNLIMELGHNHSLILSSHILPEIQAVCSRVMIMHQGHAVYDAGIDAHAGLRTLRIVLQRPPSVETLATIAGVAAVSDCGGGAMDLQVAAGSDPREALVELAVAHRWGLVELRQQTRTLEDIFVELTARDSLPDVDATLGVAA